MTSRDLQILKEQAERKVLKRLADDAMNRLVESERVARSVRYGGPRAKDLALTQQLDAIALCEEFGVLGKDC